MHNNKKIKIAIVGTHFSGKTTLSYDIVSELKRQNYKADVVREASRLSYYLAAGIRSIEMQLDLLTRHVSEELETIRTSDIIVCDRSVLDVWVYTQGFFKEKLTKKDELYIHAMEGFVIPYLYTYDIIFRKNKYFKVEDSTDELVVGDSSFQKKIFDEMNFWIDKFNLKVIDVQEDNPKEQIINSIKEFLDLQSESNVDL